MAGAGFSTSATGTARPDLLVEPVPDSEGLAERMNALQREYGARGVQLVAINSNDPHLYPDESYPRMVERAAEDGYRSRTWSTTASGSRGPTGRPARSTCSCSTAPAASATRAGSTTAAAGTGHEPRPARTRSTTCSRAGTSGCRDPTVRLQPRLRLSVEPWRRSRAPPARRPGLDAVDRLAAAGDRSPSRRSSWVVGILLVAEATGAAAALHHHALIEGGAPLALASGRSSSAGS